MSHTTPLLIYNEQEHLKRPDKTLGKECTVSALMYAPV